MLSVRSTHCGSSELFSFFHGSIVHPPHTVACFLAQTLMPIASSSSETQFLLNVLLINWALLCQIQLLYLHASADSSHNRVCMSPTSESVRSFSSRTIGFNQDSNVHIQICVSRCFITISSEDCMCSACPMCQPSLVGDASINASQLYCRSAACFGIVTFTNVPDELSKYLLLT